jgi:hypothetical protein
MGAYLYQSMSFGSDQVIWDEWVRKWSFTSFNMRPSGLCWEGREWGRGEEWVLLKFALLKNVMIHSEAVFLVVCDPSMNELWVT